MSNNVENTAERPSHYIGIGASAGGLEALQILLQNLPTDTGACFVIVQHLSPDFKSMMLELLSKHTTMAINNAQDGMEVQPNQIYLIPPKKNMMVAQGRLLLSDKMPDSGLNLPIDIFFRSLSEDQQHKAIGIILSGTGSDGSRGIKALKEAGALVIAQEPESAKFDGMPNSAINTGTIDMILRPEDMGAKLEAYIQHPLVAGQVDPIKDSMTGNEDLMSEIFSVLKMKSEIDFAKYKPSTVARRIERRMTIKQVNSLQEYFTLLFKEPYEVQVLSKELLIGVTRFFRDDEAFINLREDIIPKIVRESNPDSPIRIWTAGCSTGEEAYSMAMLFANELNRQNLQRTVKVFASDVNSDSIAEASNGLYSEDIQHDVPAHFLTSYFSKNANGSYQVNKQIRQTVIFATHNMIVDPPFSNMDFVSCRNILIYFQHSVQKRVLTSLHFSLRKDGFLFLGSSENLGDLAPHFEVINDRNRIYKKRTSLRIPIGAAPPISPSSQHSAPSMPSVTRLMKNYRGVSAGASAAGFANEVLITQYVPPCLLLNDDYQALHVYGDVSSFVRRLPPGRISVDIKDLVNDDISIAVSSALHRARQSQEEVVYTDVFTGSGSEAVGMNLRVRYIREHDVESSPGYYWLIFENAVSKDSVEETDGLKVSFDAAEQSRQRIEDLEYELKRSKEHLQVTVEELETTNEELQSANEELMSANEELQSTNEELQSVNEELYTVNSEHQEKILEITQANSDLDEVLGLSKIGIIFLDENMLIRRYTAAASKYVNLVASDINRPLHHISKNISYDEMLKDVSDVFTSGESIERDIVLPNKRVLSVTINPYKYSEAPNESGVAITFADVSQMKYTEQAMAVAYTQLRNSINNALDVIDAEPFADLKVLVVDDSAADLALMAELLEGVRDFRVEFTSVADVASALIAIRETEFDVCLVDYHLGAETALDMIAIMESEQIDVPVIVITAAKDDGLDALLLSHGALDFIDKSDLSSEVLARSMRYTVHRRKVDSGIQGAIELVSREKPSD